MPSIFSTQNLQTFLRRKNFRPPPPPPSRGAPPSGRVLGASVVAAPAPGAAVLLDSSAMILLLSSVGLTGNFHRQVQSRGTVVLHSQAAPGAWTAHSIQGIKITDRLDPLRVAIYALTGSDSPAGEAGSGAASGSAAAAASAAASAAADAAAARRPLPR